MPFLSLKNLIKIYENITKFLIFEYISIICTFLSQSLDPDFT